MRVLVVMKGYLPGKMASPLLGALLSLLPLCAVQAQPGGPASAACACGDVSNLKRRIEEADVAIATSNRQQALFALGDDGTQSVNAQPNTQLDQASYTRFRSEVQAAVISARYSEPGVNLATVAGELWPSVTTLDCSMEFSETASACMLALLTVHEKVHADDCTRLRNLGMPMPYQYNMTKRWFIEQVIAAYGQEKQFAQAQLARLQSCPGNPPASTSAPSLRNVTDLIGDSLLMELSVQR